MVRLTRGLLRMTALPREKKPIEFASCPLRGRWLPHSGTRGETATGADQRARFFNDWPWLVDEALGYRGALRPDEPRETQKPGDTHRRMVDRIPYPCSPPAQGR